MAGFGFMSSNSSGWMAPDGGPFPNPFDDLASLAMPETMPLVLRWTEYIVSLDGTYAQALNRVVSYFVTNVELDDVSDDEQEKWLEYLNGNLDIKYWIRTLGMDMLVYGNAFVSVLPGFRRSLYCPKCRKVERPLGLIADDPKFKFRWDNFQFHAYCPVCKTDGEWKHIDRKVGEADACIVKRWNPHDMELLWDPYTDSCKFIWKIPEDYKKQIREGKIHILERVPWEVIECVSRNKHMMFEDDVVYHMKEPSLAGIRNRGWGISRVLSNFRQTWYVQVLRRYNEAIALDYIIPFRIITPETGNSGTGTDPLTNFGMGNFAGQIRSMLKKRRRDPGAMNVLPFPVKYQLLGGEARQLAPNDLFNAAMETQLSNIGIPADLWKGSLQVQSAPVALRLFESSWASVPHAYNKLVSFLVKKVAKILNWQLPKAKLESVTHADDIAAQQAKLQLMMGGQVSPSTGLKSVRLNYRDEVKRTIEDQRYQAEQQAKSQAEMEGMAQMEQIMAQSQQGGAPGQPAPGGAPGQGGAPAQGGGSPPQGGSSPGAPAGPMGQAQADVAASLAIGDQDKISPQELWERANTAAQQLLGMDASQRNSELRKIKQTNPNIHPYVIQRIEQLRQEAGRQGKQMVLQQTYGGS